MSHQVSCANGSGSAAAVFAVNQALPTAPHSRFDSVTALVEVPVEVFSRVIEHRDAYALDLLEARERLLPGDINAEGDSLSREQLLVAGCLGVADEQRGSDLAELEHGQPRLQRHRTPHPPHAPAAELSDRLLRAAFALQHSPAAWGRWRTGAPVASPAMLCSPAAGWAIFIPSLQSQA